MVKREEETPWDPFWDFVLGDWDASEREKQKGFFRNGKEEAAAKEQQSGGFLSIFTKEDEARESASKRESSEEKRQSSLARRSSSGSSKDQQRRFLRRNKDETEQDDSWDISAAFHPFLYNSDEASEQQITRSWRSNDMSDGQLSTGSKAGRKKRFWKRKQDEKEEDSAAWDVTSVWESFITDDGAESAQEEAASDQKPPSPSSKEKIKLRKTSKSKSREEVAFPLEANSLIDTSPSQQEESRQYNTRKNQEGSRTKPFYSLSQSTQKSSTKEERKRKKRSYRERKKEEDSLSQENRAESASGITFLEHLADSFVGVSFSEDTDTATSRGESTLDSSLQTEEISQITEDTSNVSRSNPASKVSDEGKNSFENKATVVPSSEHKVTEVRLQFTPALKEEVGDTLPSPICEDEFPYGPFDEAKKSVGKDHNEIIHSGVGGPLGSQESLTLPDELPLPKSKSNTSGSLTVPDELPQPKSWKSNVSILEQSSSGGLIHSRNGLGKIVCCSVKYLSEEASVWTMRTGIPIHELSREELSKIFPRLRVVSDDNGFLPAANRVSEVVANSRSFENNLPAHLQATLAATGPQSLYEYEYERGLHMNVVYKEFGPNPRSLLQVLVYDKPPERIESGLFTYNKVVVQVEASTISYSDCLIRRGQWWGECSMRLPNTPGVDIVGILYRIDKDSSKRYKLCTGDRVISLTKWGGNSRYLTVNPSHLVKVPEQIDPAEAVCLAETYMTAFQVLHFGQSPGKRYRSASLKGRSFLIIGSMTSNMGRAISQLAGAANAHLVYATAKSKHFELLSGLGILPLSQDPTEWWEKLQEKIDVVISLEQAVTSVYHKLLKEDGTIIEITKNDMDLVQSPVSKVVCSRHKSHEKSRTHTYDVFKEWDTNLDRCKKDLAHLVSLLKHRIVAPYILDRIPLSKVSQAHEVVESNRDSGYLICEPWLLSKSRAVRL